MPQLVYTPREQQLAIIDELERGEKVDVEKLIEAYKHLAKAYEHHGNTHEQELAYDNATLLSKGTEEERQQFFIDKMEECDDIDLDALAQMYDAMAATLIVNGKEDEAEEAKSSAHTLRELFVTSGRSRRESPRSIITRAESAGINPFEAPEAASALNDGNSSNGGCSNRGSDRGSDNGDSKEEDAPVEHVKQEKRVRWIRHDSICSPIIKSRPTSRGSSRQAPSTSTSTSTAESKETDTDDGTMADEKKNGDASGAKSYGSEAKNDEITNVIKQLSFESDAKDAKNAEPASAHLTPNTKGHVGFDEGSNKTYGDDHLDEYTYGENCFEEDADEYEGVLEKSAEEIEFEEKQESEIQQKALLKNNKKPMCFVTWDGEPDSWENVDKLMRFLRAKGYVVFEHAGDDCTGSSAKIPGFSASNLLDTTGSVDSLSSDGAGGADSKINATSSIGSLDEKSSVDASLSPGVMGGSTSTTNVATTPGASARAKVARVLVDKMSVSTVFVACVTRKFTRNLNCKKLVLKMREIQIEKGKKAAEMLYVMVHGTFTTESQPYHCRDGWLGYLLRDSLWSPAWSHAHIQGAAEAISATVSLRRSIVTLHPSHILYIESRGRQGVCPPCFTKPR